MCGIAGYIGQVSDSERINAKMTESMLHRGPDQQATVVIDQVTLLHNRLKIIDLSDTANQPMPNEDNTLWLVFNGEIYNHKKLRKQLLNAGHEFRSKTDSEVIIHAYEQWGTLSFKKLKGMFAFALFDRKQQKLLLCRDRFGIKPLYFSQQAHQFVFASELNTIMAFAGSSQEVNRQAIADYVQLFYVPAPSTFYKHIHALSPGHYAEVDCKQSTWRSIPFLRWDPDINMTISQEEAIEQCDELAQNAVSSQLESDVALGTMLSGGIDSSLISYFAKTQLGGIDTYNVKFPDRENDETWAALEVAKHIQSNHRVLPMELGQGSIEEIDKITDMIGQPYCDTSIFAASAIFKRMKEEVVVALSGDGGDEGFAGYNYYRHINRTWPFIRLNRHVQNAVIELISTFSRFGGSFQRAAIVSSNFKSNTPCQFIMNFFQWIRKNEANKLIRDFPSFQPTERLIQDQYEQVYSVAIPDAEKLMLLAAYCNKDLTLANDFLIKTDMSSMQESLEVRVPFLDENLFEFGLNLPAKVKLKNGTKSMLRSVASKYLPKSIAAKKKWGFGLPLDIWINDETRHELCKVLNSSNAPIADYLHPQEYTAWTSAFENNTRLNHVSREGLYQRIIMLYSLNRYLQKFG